MIKFCGIGLLTILHYCLLRPVGSPLMAFLLFLVLILFVFYFCVLDSLSLVLLFLLRVALAILSLLCFHLNFTVIFASFVKDVIGV